MIRIPQSKKDSDLQLRYFSFSMATSLLFLTEQGDGLEGLCLPHFNGMETSAIALTKVILELDSQVLSYVKLILLTVACEYTSAS